MASEAAVYFEIRIKENETGENVTNKDESSCITSTKKQQQREGEKGKLTDAVLYMKTDWNQTC